MTGFLSGLRAQGEDKIIGLMKAFAADPRPTKIDLGVGVYKTPEGRTPVMRAVKAAEAQLLQDQETKTYVALAGDPAFHAALTDLVLGEAAPQGRCAALATPGGTGAVRQALELVIKARPQAKLWMSDPTWPNHPAIADAMHIPHGTYRYYDPATGGVAFEQMLQDLAEIPAGDVVLLHGCCHNPTGADLTPEQWQAITALLARTGALPLVDLAYQGFGSGLETDAAGLRHMARTLPEMLLAISCSKNFGLYRERVGLLLVVCETPAQRDITDGTLSWLNRLSYAFPPDHGARVVTMILTDPTLRAQWQAELDEMRSRVAGNRAALADALRAQTNSDRFDGLARQQGMFSLLGATPAQVVALREENGIYMVGDGRINLAGLTPDNTAVAAQAIARHL